MAIRHSCIRMVTDFRQAMKLIFVVRVGISVDRESLDIVPPDEK